MRTRTKAISAAILISCLILFGTLFFLTWYVRSGRLHTLIENRAGEAIGASVSINTLRFHWPSQIYLEGLTVSIPEADALPVFSCSKLTIATSIGKLMRKRIDSLVLVGVRINLAEDSAGRLMIPDIPASDRPFSFGTIKVVDGEITLEMSAINADIKGILATLSESLLPASDEKVLVLNIDAVQGTIRPNDMEQIPVGCKVFQSKFVFRPKPSATEVEAEMTTLVTADIPYLRLPVDIPVNLSLATDYLSDKDSLENGIFSLSMLPFTKVRIYGSMANLSSGSPDLNLNLTAEAAEVSTLLEYCELLQRPNYKGMEVRGQVRMNAEIGGTLGEPEISLRAKATDGQFGWKGFVLEGLNAEMPISIDAEGFSAGPGKISGDRAVVPIGEKKIEATALGGLLSVNASGVTAEDCSLQLGEIGTISMSGDYEFDSGLLRGHVDSAGISLEQVLGKEMEVKGKVRVSAEIAGILERPEVSVQAKAIDGGLEWKGFVLEGLAAEMPISIDAEGFSAGPGKISGDRAVVPIGEKKIEATALGGLLSVNASGVTAEDCSLQLGEIGTVSMSGTYEFDSGLLRGRVHAEDISVEQTLGFVSPILGQVPDTLTGSGRLTLESDIQAKLATTLEGLNADYKISLKEGEFSSGEFMTVAGIGADISGSVGMDATGELWQFDASGKAGGFEMLIDIFYKNFSENNFPFSVSGEYVPEGQQVRNAKASLDLGQMGTLSARGTAQLNPSPAYDMELKADGVDLGEVFEQIGKKLLPEMSPFFNEAEVGGLASGNFSMHGDGDRQDIRGRIKLEDGLLDLGKGAFRTAPVSINLPFDIYFPAGKESRAAVRFLEEDYGRIELANVAVGPVDVPSLVLDIAVKGNALRIKDPAPIEVFGGILDVGAIHGEELLGSSLRMSTSLSGTEMKLDKATEKLGLPKVDGTVDAQFPSIELSFDSIATEGKASVKAFGGNLDIMSVKVYKPLSSVRTFAADLEVKEFDLFGVTNVLDFGSISGVMEGTLKGLEVSQGQPEAFDADFKTVKRKGVQQKINFDAVRNITILGTGHGFQAGLGRGFATFFDEFGYDTIGFYCTLKNDNFRMQGKVVQGDTEYFVKGVRLGPSINVINRNPGQTVSFKSMIERINRIKAQESTQEK